MENKCYVDITSPDYGPVTAVEWFHGYGGNDLGLGRAIPGLRSVAVCERDAFVVANMVAKMEAGLLDAVPIWTDVTDFPTEPFGYQRLDLFIASYPCQGFSHAGKRLGKDDHRHLWPYCRTFIQAVRPGWVWLENVEGHVSLGLSTVLADLAEDGYKAAWGIFSASEVGAPHQRKRVFILVYDRSNGHIGRALPYGIEGRGIQEQAQFGPEYSVVRGEVDGRGERASSEDVAILLPRLEGHAGDVNRTGRESGGEGGPVAEGGLPTGERAVDDSEAENPPMGERDGQVWPARPGQRQYAWEPPRVTGNMDDAKRGSLRNDDGQNPGQVNEFEGADVARTEANGEAQPPMGGNADGPAAGLDLSRCSGLSHHQLAEIREWMVKGTNRTDELRMCGNGVVPQCAEKAFRVLWAELMEKRNGN